MGLWRFLQAELLLHPLLSLSPGGNCWEGIPQQLQLRAGWGRNPPAAPWDSQYLIPNIPLHCCCSFPGDPKTGRKRWLVQHGQGKWETLLWPDIPYNSPEWRHLCFGLGRLRTVQQEGNNSFKCDLFKSKLDSEHPSGSSLASPPAGKTLWMMISRGASAKELVLQPRVKEGAE